MTTFGGMIEGTPCSRFKRRGRAQAVGNWMSTVRRAAKDWPKVRGACMVGLYFYLGAEQFPKDYPFGPDLDNLTKSTLDGLGETVFSDAPGKDSCVVLLNVSKNFADYPTKKNGFPVGCHVTIRPFDAAEAKP